MRMRGAIPILLMAALGAAWVPAEAEAQQRGPRGEREMTREQMQERAQRMYEARMARALDLTDEQQEELREVLAHFREARLELLPERRELRREMAGFLAEGGEDDEKAMEILEMMRELRQAEARIHREEHERLLEVLTPSQVVRLHHVREEFGQRIRRLEGDGPRIRIRPGPGGTGAWLYRPGAGKLSIDVHRSFRLRSGHGFHRPRTLLRPLRGPGWHRIP